MKGMIVKVFLVIGVLIACLVLWNLFLGDDGLLSKGWNLMGSEINETVQDLTGTSDDIIDEWESPDNLDGAQGLAGGNN